MEGVKLDKLAIRNEKTVWERQHPGVGRLWWRNFRRMWDQRRPLFLAVIAIVFFCIAIFARIAISDGMAGSNFSIVAVLNVVSGVASLVAFGAFFQAIEFTPPEQQYEGALSKINEIIDNQASHGISEVLKGGKFFDIIEKLDVEPGDKIKIYWSFLQHEEITDRFFAALLEKNLSVEIMLFMPFSKALDQRTRELVRNMKTPATSNLKAKSFANIDFRNHFISTFCDTQTSASGKKPTNAHLRYTDAYLARPMIVVCKPDTNQRRRRDGGANRVGAADTSMKDLKDALPNSTSEHSGSTGTSKVKREDWRPDKADDYKNIQVAMGHFLTEESSKYPFVVFNWTKTRERESEIAQQSENICRDAIEFFNQRFSQAKDGTKEEFWHHLDEKVREFEEECKKPER
jgi:hypothetical protein